MEWNSEQQRVQANYGHFCLFLGAQLFTFGSLAVDQKERQNKIAIYYPHSKRINSAHVNCKVKKQPPSLSLLLLLVLLVSWLELERLKSFLMSISLLFFFYVNRSPIWKANASLL